MKTLIVVLFLAPLVAAAQPQLTVLGKVTGLKDGDLVALTDVNNPTDTIASSLVKAGVFSMKGHLAEPSLLNLTLTGSKPEIVFFNNDKVTITGANGSLDKMKITGSTTQSDFKEFQTTFNPLFETLGKSVQAQRASANADSVAVSVNNQIAAIQKKVDVYLQKHPASAVSAFLVMATSQLSQDETVLTNRVGKLKPAALNNVYGTYLKQLAGKAKLNAVGSQALDFSQTDTAGVSVSLASFRGKYVLVDFWASWCGPCRQENPNVVANYKRFKDKNFTVLGVSLDRPGQKDKWLQAIHTDNLTWTHVSDLQFWSNAVAQLYHIEEIPQNLLIGPDGKIIAKNLRGPALQNKLCELFGCN